MADQSDVEQALVNLVLASLYPSGVSSSSSVSPVAGAVCDIRRGWPVSAVLDAAMAAGQVLVTIFPEMATHNSTRYFLKPQVPTIVAPTIQITVNGATITFGGLATAGNVVGIQYGGSAQLQTAAYILLPNDSPESIVAILSGKIPGSSFSNTSITLPTADNVAALAMVPQTVLTETRRQDQSFRITCWCPTPALRDTVAKAIDNAAANLRDAYGNLTRFMALADGSAGWLRFSASHTFDVVEKTQVYRRDLCYMVEYPTTLVEQDPQMLFGIGTLITENAAGLQTGEVSFGAEVPQTSPEPNVLTDESGNPYVDLGGNIIVTP